MDIRAYLVFKNFWRAAITNFLRNLVNFSREKLTLVTLEARRLNEFNKNLALKPKEWTGFCITTVFDIKTAEAYGNHL